MEQVRHPQSLIRYDGYLASGLKADTAVLAARNWLNANKALFRLSSVAGLELVNDARLVKSNGHAVLFRQKFGLRPSQDGMATVGVTGSKAAGWKVAYVSSSITGAYSASGRKSRASPPQRRGSTPRRRSGASSPLCCEGSANADGAVLLKVAGVAGLQRVREAAIPTPSGVRPAYEVIVLETSQKNLGAYTSTVDAVTGKVLTRQNNLQQLADHAPQAAMQTTPFNGSFTPTTCGNNGPFPVPAETKSIRVFAAATNGSNDIVLKLLFNGTVIAEADTFTSPEFILYEPGGNVPAGVYTVQVCPFTEDSVPFEPRTYTGEFTTNDQATAAVPYPPRWKYFTSNPPADYSNRDSRVFGCWNDRDGQPATPGCTIRLQPYAGYRGPWDHNPDTNRPTFTTVGNNANSAESWFSFLAPGPTGFRPTSDQREYNYSWTNQWFTSKCNPAVFATAQANDRSAATANLFALHNRMHDWSYVLGFTEENYNLQVNNFGLTEPGAFPGREKDPELGDVQAGAVNGGAPSYVGRDNANQITLQDGVAPITNMYLWQPISGGFYAPCVDGDYDMSVVGHEYGHAIQNRMVAGPDAGLSGLQARSMGESWSDLTAVEFLASYGYSQGQGNSRFAVGPYVTGSPLKGIRNYGMDNSPLNYSNIEYDPAAVTSPHADGEIWSATNYDIRKLLIDKYNDKYPAGDVLLQQRCARGELPPQFCPGNRRWVQIFHDAFLLSPSGVSFVDSRDAYLAADRMRFSGANQTELWRAFARRGLGFQAASTGSDDRDPRISFRSPRENSASITFNVTSPDEANKPIPATVYVGDYEARSVPLADTNAGTPLGATQLMVGGTYTFLVQAKGYGFLRTTQTFNPGQQVTLNVPIAINRASTFRGATASGDGNNQRALIDDTETTNWSRLALPVAGAQVTVDLAGGTAHLVKRVQVSAMLRPANPNDPGGDTGSQSRFSALRQFAIETCNATSGANCALPTGYTRIFTSSPNAFPAGRPRPLAPDFVRGPSMCRTPTPLTYGWWYSPTTVLAVRIPGRAGQRSGKSTDCTTTSPQAKNVARQSCRCSRGSPTHVEPTVATAGPSPTPRLLVLTPCAVPRTSRLVSRGDLRPSTTTVNPTALPRRS
ncbi:MAG: M36 family metallopeptidase [Chloroflexia bacterium]